MNSSKLKTIIKKIFIKYNLSKDHASISADALINAELVGAYGHGLSRLKMYCDRISKKVINPKAKIKVKKIAWFGAYGNGNLGDDLIFYSLKRLIKNKNFEIILIPLILSIFFVAMFIKKVLK